MSKHELLRELVKRDVTELEQTAAAVPVEIVFKALIIREFMAERGIGDPRSGMRAFYAFQRANLQRHGFVRPSAEGQAA